MKNTILILFFAFSGTTSFSQSLYQYFYGYEAGFHKACNCNKQIEKTNSLLYHIGTYNEGFDAGYIDGRIYLNQNDTNNKSEEQNLYSPDYQLIEKVLKAKQEQYENQIKAQNSEIERQNQLMIEKAQSSNNQVKAYYNGFKTYPQQIKNGWHKVWVSNNTNFCDERKVYVENNTITKYLVGDVSLRGISSTLPISNGKTILKLNGPDIGLLDVYFLEALANPENTTVGPKVTGKAMFWMNFGDKGKVHLIIEGINFGDLTTYFASSAPSCGQTGTIMFEAIPGTYSYTASCGELKWSGTFTITENSCVSKKLTL
jgi:hypothetical protein